MKTQHRIIGVVISLTFMLFSFNHCVIKQETASKSKTGTSNSTSSSSEPTANLPDPIVDITPEPEPTPMEMPPDPVIIQSQTIDIGVKNFEQINETMAVLTGVDPMTNAIRNTYRDLEVQLPTDNSIKSFLAANQVAITKLAAEYCDQLVNSGTLRAQVWPGLNFGRSPAQELSNNTQRFNVIDQTMNRFWGEQMGGSRNASQLELFSLMSDLLSGENLNSNNTTRTTMKGICTATLSSAQVILL